MPFLNEKRSVPVVLCSEIFWVRMNIDPAKHIQVAKVEI